MRQPLIDRIPWEEEDTVLAARLERVAYSIRGNTENLLLLWGRAAKENPFVLWLVLNKLRTRFRNLEQVEQGEKILADMLREKQGSEENVTCSDLLAALEMRDEELGCAFITRLSGEKLRTLAPRLEQAPNIETSICYLLKLMISAEPGSWGVLSHALADHFRLSAQQAIRNEDLKTSCAFFLRCGNRYVLLQIITIFENLSLCTLLGVDRGEILSVARAGMHPEGVLFYDRFLQAEGLHGEDLIRELGVLEPDPRDSGVAAWDSYVILCAKLREMPEKAGFFRKNHLLPLTLEALNPVMQKKFDKLIDAVFCRLMEVSPYEALPIMRKLSPCNTYLYRRDEVFKRSSVWSADIGARLPQYMLFLNWMKDNMDPQTAIDLYMNSPMKAIVDFHALIRRCFLSMDNGRVINLAPYLNKYRFYGMLKENHHNYRVTMNSACSSYAFPVHITWCTENADFMEETMCVGDIVSYNITGLELSRGMIFAKNLKMERRTGTKPAVFLGKPETLQKVRKNR